ncbi:protein-L-isoaspartate(D-aspartate) O-methyltransferase [Deferrisoma camini]|uniref:protein-L-isoaspartate(D-aspartate) O-methyltransferase n=1 Tax=Deferrisoma camini TaxID=1035120 RepID=UPI00046CE03F|nr:protein-L-isoaspartate(D-aspartate) O-methyltransferase [Deferrisoma camini]
MRRLLGGALVLLVAAGTARAGDPYARARARMIRAVEADVAATRARIGRDRLAPAVMEALARVPRHEFVPPEWKDRAYENRPLPIGYGQTISQPYIVALMTDLAGVGPGDRVLEVGTGSGYQAAVLAALGCRVFTVEIIPALAEAARRRLRRLGYDRVRVRLGDGYYGWPEHAPFDAILVTAAADHVPPPLVRQLRPGGRMVIPVGGAFRVQTLTVVEKAADGRVSSREVLPVRFVPLTGGGRL